MFFFWLSVIRNLNVIFFLSKRYKTKIERKRVEWVVDINFLRAA